jgi:hypothetical protein
VLFGDQDAGFAEAGGVAIVTFTIGDDGKPLQLGSRFEADEIKIGHGDAWAIVARESLGIPASHRPNCSDGWSISRYKTPVAFVS